MPHVVPAGFRCNPQHDTIDIGGHDFATGKKYRDALRHPKVALVIESIASVGPWRVRGVKIRGEMPAPEPAEPNRAGLRTADVPDHAPERDQPGPRRSHHAQRAAGHLNLAPKARVHLSR